jgi:hypothetical protein
MLLMRGALLVILSTLLHEQARAPFTGTVRDEGGKPLAGAAVREIVVQ